MFGAIIQNLIVGYAAYGVGYAIRKASGGSSADR
jgi:hypothetical protein